MKSHKCRWNLSLNKQLVKVYLAFWQPIKDLCCFQIKQLHFISRSRPVQATTRSGYVISCYLIGSELNQNIDLTAKRLSSTEMSNRETSKQIAVGCFGWNVPWRKVTAIRSQLIEIILCVIAFDLRISRS